MRLVLNDGASQPRRRGDKKTEAEAQGASDSLRLRFVVFIVAAFSQQNLPNLQLNIQIKVNKM